MRTQITYSLFKPIVKGPQQLPWFLISLNFYIFGLGGGSSNSWIDTARYSYVISISFIFTHNYFRQTRWCTRWPTPRTLTPSSSRPGASSLSSTSLQLGKYQWFLFRFFYFRRTESSKAVARTSDGLFMSFSGRMVDYGGPFIFRRLMFFSLPRCGPCKMIAPHLEEMSKTMDDVVFLKVAKLLLCLT